jgi:hypothetical protein
VVAGLLWAAPLWGLPVFPGAVGFGSDTPAGRGGEIYRVTTLADAGPGSLREGVEKLRGPRIIVFDVSGVIRLSSDLVVRPGQGFLTIAGQTAPWPGITLANAGVAIRAHDILIRHLAIRPGDRLRPVENRDAIKIGSGPGEPVHHVVIDHVSASWAVDETMSTWADKGSVRDVTLSSSMLSEPIINGGHPKGSHPYGPLVGRNSSNVTLVGNIIAFALGRNPLIRDRTGGAQVVNNFIYRPGVWSNSVIYVGDLTLPPHAVSVIGNVAVRHPLPFQLEQTDTKGQRKVVSYAKTDYRQTGIFVHDVISPEAGLYLADNRFFDPQTQTWHPTDGDPWNPVIFRDSSVHPVARLASDPYANSGGTAWQPRPASEVESRLLAGAGKLPARRDPLDAQLTEKIRTRTGGYRTDLASGSEDPWAVADVQRRRPLALPANPSADDDGNGYTNVEDWLHQLAAGIEVDGHAWLARELAHASFASADWQKQWTLEGNARVRSGDGRLNVVTADEKAGEPAATLWWREPLPKDVLIEFTAGADLPVENNAANLSLMLGAREVDGSPYRGGRSGAYSEYKNIPNYLLALTGGFQEGGSRVHRNPGFTRLAENPEARSEPGRVYRVRVAIAGGRIRYWLDGRLVHDVQDAHPLDGGHFALRTRRSRVWWSDLRIYALSRAKEEGPVLTAASVKP